MMIGIVLLAAFLGALVTVLIQPSSAWTALGWWTLTSSVLVLVVGLYANWVSTTRPYRAGDRHDADPS